MSEQVTAGEYETSERPESALEFPGAEFGQPELEQFEADDREAGANIGKMLTVFFLYSLVIMAGVVVAAYLMT